MRELSAIPELVALGSHGPLIRIPPEIDVPLTNRVRAVMDTVEFRRLAHVGQLGLVVLAYPGAMHSRFEHSLGVYRLMLLFLQRLAADPRFRAVVTVEHAEARSRRRWFTTSHTGRFVIRSKISVYRRFRIMNNRRKRF
ncbi:MAG: hypothetical protein QM811_05480 [Pirellulales bacterium]